MKDCIKLVIGLETSNKNCLFYFVFLSIIHKVSYNANIFPQKERKAENLTLNKVFITIVELRFSSIVGKGNPRDKT